MNKQNLHTAGRALALAGVLILGGCATQTMHAATAQVDQVAAKAQQAAAPRSQSVVQVVNTPWLMGEKVHIAKPKPAFLRRTGSLENPYQALTLPQIAQLITSYWHVPVEIDPSVYVAPSGTAAPAAVPLGATSANSAAGTTAIKVNYTGTLEGLLNVVDSGLGIYSEAQPDGSILFFATKTETFEIPALNKPSTLTSLISSASSTGAASGSGGASSTATTGTGAITAKSTATIDVWKALKATAQAIAGPGAQVVADPADQMLVVTATPPQLTRVSAWVHRFSADLLRRVEVDIQVYSVQLTREDDVGFNPTVVFNNLGQRYGFTVAGAPTPSLSNGLSPASFGASVLTPTSGSTNVGFYGSSAVLQALSTLGHSSLVVTGTAITQNGQPAVVQSATQSPYVSSITTTPSVTAGIAPTTAVTQSSYTVGFIAKVLPRIVDGHILLGMDMSLSNLVKMNTQTYNGATVQQPTISMSPTSNTVPLLPGETLMFSDIQEDTAQISHNGVGNPDFMGLGGGRDANTGKSMLVILVTPRLV